MLDSFRERHSTLNRNGGGAMEIAVLWQQSIIWLHHCQCKINDLAQCYTCLVLRPCNMGSPRCNKGELALIIRVFGVRFLQIASICNLTSGWPSFSCSKGALQPTYRQPLGIAWRATQLCQFRSSSYPSLPGVP